MNSMYAVDAYVRDYFRKAVLDALLAEKLPVTVFGEGWEKYSCGDEHSLRREPAVPFALSFERITKAHVLLNVSPGNARPGSCRNGESCGGVNR